MPSLQDTGTDDEAENALEELLGISLDALNDEAWDNQSGESSAIYGDDGDDDGGSPPVTPHDQRNPIQPSAAVKLSGTDRLFKNAYICSGHCTACPKIQKPDVSVVNIEGRGKALLATRNFEAHKVVFTEVAEVSVQVNNTLACQFCMRSLVGPPESLPHAHYLWPVHSPVECHKCRTSFCSATCREKYYQNWHGSCCVDVSVDDPAVALALKMAKQLDGFEFLCGSALDSAGFGDNGADETLQSLSLGGENSISMDAFLGLLAKARRNGVGIQTLSPFQTYYNGLVRTLGRNSRQLPIYKEQIAKLFGLGEGIDRDTDQYINDRVSTKMVGIFSLTAMMNHDCDPNCKIVSAYADHHLDVVARKPIQKGDEITISYVRSRLGVNQRQKELRSKYLFDCGCAFCLRREVSDRF